MDTTLVSSDAGGGPWLLVWFIAVIIGVVLMFRFASKQRQEKALKIRVGGVKVRGHVVAARDTSSPGAALNPESSSFLSSGTYRIAIEYPDPVTGATLVHTDSAESKYLRGAVPKQQISAFQFFDVASPADAVRNFSAAKSTVVDAVRTRAEGASADEVAHRLKHPQDQDFSGMVRLPEPVPVVVYVDDSQGYRKVDFDWA